MIQMRERPLRHPTLETRCHPIRREPRGWLAVGALGRSGALAVGLCALVAGLWPRVARAQESPPADRSFSIQLFEPATGQDGLFTVESALSPGHLGVTAGLVIGYQHNPFSIFPCRTGTGGQGQPECDLDMSEPSARVVESHVELDLLASLTVIDMFQFAVTLPVTLFQDGDGILVEDGDTWSPEGLSANTGLGDIRLHLKWTAPFGLARGARSGFGLAIAPVISFPTGNAVAGDAFMGDGMVTVHPQVLAEYRWNGLQVAARFGYRWREESQIYSTEIGHHITYGAGLSYTFTLRPGYTLRPVAEIFGANGFTTQVDQNPVEVEAGLQARLASDFVVSVGVGAGVVSAVGVPQARTFVGFLYAPRRSDADGDGVRDSEDQCPTEREDADDFQDEDGCPDNDNDQDGLLDAEDRCPNESEDTDQFEDEDGCPDNDNDQDGVVDGYDGCPAEREDRDAFQDDDGCPDLDHDQDNIPEPADHCPFEPEDTDGFGDEDGCPETDYDADGQADEGDGCPEQAEDPDGFQDDDGCDDTDNDGDGIPDQSDQCVDRPETLNGMRDEDGCPDGGRALVVITREQIEIREQIRFERDSDAIVGTVSFQILDIVINVLRQNPNLRIRVEGHTDDTGSREHNVELSQRRADSVRLYLVEHGIAAERLEAQGFGPDRPLESNRSSSGRAANRRVEFHILGAERPPEPTEASGGEEATPAPEGESGAPAGEGEMSFSPDEAEGQ